MAAAGAIIQRPQWVPDASVLACTRCRVAFSFDTRRHHCRLALTSAESATIPNPGSARSTLRVDRFQCASDEG